MTARHVAAIAALPIVLMICTPSGAPAQQPAGTEQAVTSFVVALQRAVRAGDRAGVARLTHFPLRVNHGPKVHQLVRTSAALQAGYAAIFISRVRDAILAQKPDRAALGPQGISIALGAVWAQMVCAPQSRRGCRVELASVNIDR
ncbi:MAG TPA: hypothetical protein VGM20_00090 [Gemmatimonadales bacterium]|jgi:hypothetical protein